MKKYIIWIAIAVVIAILLAVAWVRSRRRTQESAEMKRKADQTVVKLINDKDSRIEALEAELAAKLALQEEPQKPVPNLLISYPAPTAAQSNTQHKKEVEVSDEAPPPTTTKVETKNKAKSPKPPKKASEAEIALHGHLTHDLESTDLDGKIKLIQEFLKNPIARQYKGVMAKKLNLLLAKKQEQPVVAEEV